MLGYLVLGDSNTSKPPAWSNASTIWQPALELGFSSVSSRQLD
jgi:hypothetical protein